MGLYAARYQSYWYWVRVLRGINLQYAAEHNFDFIIIVVVVVVVVMMMMMMMMMMITGGGR